MRLPRANAFKNVVLGAANGVAALGFVLFGPVHWSAAVPLAVGLLVGGRIGPVVVRRAPVGPLRVVIGVAALGPRREAGHRRVLTLSGHGRCAHTTVNCQVNVRAAFAVLGELPVHHRDLVQALR